MEPMEGETMTVARNKKIKANIPENKRIFHSVSLVIWQVMLKSVFVCINFENLWKKNM